MSIDVMADGPVLICIVNVHIPVCHIIIIMFAGYHYSVLEKDGSFHP